MNCEILIVFYITDAQNHNLIVKAVPWLISDRNKTEAVRDWSTVCLMDCAVV